ncbi:MAG TPA: response regulator transcription factor [Blastocatellia bacterium]|jgi:DNA-binding response OmpR family regulator|nr:response regulator transcription factor [Blastocatellia bacterium]
MNGARILVTDDDKKTLATLQLYLEHAGFDVRTARSGLEALEQVRVREPDLIILDLMLPQVGGLEVCRKLRAESDIPIIMLTARTTEEDKLVGLDLGADDYVTKPFSPRELVARVKAVLRRRASQVRDSAPPELGFDDLVIDLKRHEVRVRGSRVYLTPAEFRLLEVFVKAPDRVFTRQELVERAFGWNYEGLDRTVDAHVMNLRRKIERDRLQPSFILTVYGVGYKFSGDRHVS